MEARQDSTEDRTSEITQLLKSWREGDSGAPEDLLPLVYRELRVLAASYLRRERAGHTLQTTALVHEAYLRLWGGGTPDVSDRSHFFAVAAQAMRRILVDHARRQQAGKRIGPRQQVPLEEAPEPQAEHNTNVLAVHEALELLSQISPRQAQLVELRYFGGLSNEEAAEVLGISLATLARDWRIAKRWLYRKLGT